jgi:hypothetical protein
MTVRAKSSETTEDSVRPGDGSASEHLREVEKAAVVSRRGALWRMGAATVAGVGVLSALDQHRAEAITGGNFILGNSNNAGATTTLVRTSATSPSPLMKVDGTGLNATATAALQVVGTGGGAALYAQGFSSGATIATIGLAINGAGSGSANGIYGSSGSGTGVFGQASSGGIGVRGTSNTSSGVVGGSGTSPAAPAATGVYGYAAGSTARGVFGETTNGHGVHGKADSNGWAGYFIGKVYMSKYQEMQEVTNPSAPAANKARIFVRDNGSGKTQLCVRFSSGAIQVIKTQP